MKQRLVWPSWSIGVVLTLAACDNWLNIKDPLPSALRDAAADGHDGEDAPVLESGVDAPGIELPGADTMPEDTRRSTSTCTPISMAFASTLVSIGGSASQTPCVMTATGLVFSYSISPSTWDGCQFLADAHIPLLDADRPDGGQGLLEIRLCTIGQPASGTLDLYFGTYPVRRRWPLSQGGKWLNGQLVTPDQCVILQLRPREALYPTRATSGGVTYPWPSCLASENDCGSIGSTCEPSGGFDSPLAIVAEWPPTNTSGSVRLESIRYFPQECLCQSDDDCAIGTSCLTLRNQGACASASAGVCMACPGEGEACQVTAGGKSCASTLICAEGVPFCPCSPA